MSVAVSKTEWLSFEDPIAPMAKRLSCSKRVMDVVLGTMALVLLSPLMLLCIGMVKMVDPGQAIYSQWRVGLNGRLFRIYKLRTMRRSAEWDSGAVCATQDDSRIIGCCRWMRRSHLDELPQLINIIRGDMSLVGPRPERPEIHAAVARQLPAFNQRLAVKPGLTGLAQVRNGYTNDLAGCRCKLHYDLLYIRRAGVWQDIRLMISTIPKLWDREAC